MSEDFFSALKGKLNNLDRNEISYMFVCLCRFEVRDDHVYTEEQPGE